MALQVGLVGTGYAAQKRAEALRVIPRLSLAVVWGQISDRAHAIAQAYDADGGVEVADEWLNLVQRHDIDLVMVATRNHLHGPIVRAALTAGKHVVVEYPLALDVTEAEDLVALARSQQRLLHVEHIELLSGIHQTIKMALTQVGRPLYCYSTSFKGERPVPPKWTYNVMEFGFPLTAALSRIQRLIDLFGLVEGVNCNCQYWDQTGQPFIPSRHRATYASVLCNARLHFRNGVWADIVYGKGEGFWSRERIFDVQGTKGRLLVNPEGGNLIDDNGSQFLSVGSRKGLFVKDTIMVLEALEHQQPLYITPEASLYALKVADAAQRSAASGGGSVLTPQHLTHALVYRSSN